MTDVALREASSADLLAAPGDAAGDLVNWARAAQQAYQIACRLAETSFVPKAMSRRPEEVTGAILAGRELGLSPMAALRSIDVIDGTPAMRAHALRGLVQSAGHEVWVEESTDTRAVVCGRRRRGPIAGFGDTQRSVWTIDRAKKAGLAGKRNWTTHPAAMLVARATAEVCRLIASDVLLGMPYAVEEITDDGWPEQAASADDAGEAKPRKRIAKRAPVAPAEGDATPDAHPRRAAEVYGDAPAPPLVAPGAEPMSAQQRAQLDAAYRDVGMEDRVARLAHASQVVGRDLAGANELTMAEGWRVIDNLSRLRCQHDEPDEPADERAQAEAWPEPARPPEEAP